MTLKVLRINLFNILFMVIFFLNEYFKNEIFEFIEIILIIIENILEEKKKLIES